MTVKMSSISGSLAVIMQQLVTMQREVVIIVIVMSHFMHV